MSEAYDVAVIGAGMAGASLGAELAPHARVLIAEAEDLPGYHATGRSAAFWEECYGGPGVVPLTLAPNETWTRTFEKTSVDGGKLIARINHDEALPADNTVDVVVRPTRFVWRSAGPA